MDIDVVKKLCFWRKNTAATQLGVYIAQDAVWIYKQADEINEAIAKEYPFHNKDWQQVFTSITSDFGPAQLQIVLSAAWYQLLIIDTPNVEPSEIPQALVWAVKDMVSIPVVDLHLDYYQSPILNRNKITVVVTDKTELSALVTAISNSKNTIVGITIEQLAICNLNTETGKTALIISHYRDQDLLFTIIKDGLQYMQRRIRGFSDINKINAEDLSRLGTVDNLTLELQRSMDYFESQMRQAPVNDIEIMIDGASHPLANLLAKHFHQPVKVVNNAFVGGKMAELVYQNFRKDQQ